MLRVALASALLLGSAVMSTTAMAVQAPQEQVWEATINNLQRVCGVEYNGAKSIGGILTKNEQGTDNSKAITFRVKANTQDVYWKITEAKIIENQQGYDFNADLMTQATKANTSLFVNNREYAWADTRQEQYIQKQDKYIKLAPKINMDESELPFGTTKVQGKLVVTCGSGAVGV